MKAKEIRKSAREAMSGKWGRFVGMNLLLSAISILAVIVAFLPTKRFINVDLPTFGIPTIKAL